jgi:mRNA-degrading endonuclease RelE of RelBE toxin-antitoxin system
LKIKAYASFAHFYRNLPDALKRKCDQKILLLSQNIKHPSLHTKKIKGSKNIWELRVDIHYRMTFEIVNDTIFLRVVGKHEEALRSP